MKRLLVLLGFCLTLSSTFAQENCNNNFDDNANGLVDCLDNGFCATKTCEICDDGIDNDGDRFIDCFDKECTLNAACKDFFIGKTVSCEVKPDTFKGFKMRERFRSQVGITNHVNRLLVGDVDSDGVPEIVTLYRNQEAATVSRINILSAPASGNILDTTYINMMKDGLSAAYEDLAMADIDRDGCAEIFALTKTSDGTGFGIMAYDACTKQKKWTAPITFPNNGENGGFPGTMGLADFDRDGYVELYVRAEIYDAHSGAPMGRPKAPEVYDFPGTSNAPIAVNILDASPNLELVAGCKIYNVNIDRPAPPPAIPPNNSTVTMALQHTSYSTRRGRAIGSGTSVADFNLDGKLDVLAIGQVGGRTSAVFWDPHNNVFKSYSDPVNNWGNGAGRINIADVDGDGKMNAIYVSGVAIYVLKEGATNLEVLWKQAVDETTSGFTGCTMFDFNADGKSEIVYRDEQRIFIYNTEVDGGGAITVTRTSQPCKSRTSNEYPIVADMDGDGHTEICVTCSTSLDTLTASSALGLWSPAVVKVFESANDPWVPARRVWNQHGYFVVNVNDDLTIPENMQDHHLLYSLTAQCTLDGKVRPFNSFLNQAPHLNQFGCPSFPAPNLAVLPYAPGKNIDYTPPICPQDSIELSYRFMNRGDISLSGNLKISFYNGDPRLTAAPLATRLATLTMPLADMEPGDTLVSTVKIKGPGSAFRLFIVLNDNGTTIPLDFSKQTDRIKECEYDNIIDANIVPEPAPLTPVLIRDNLKCLTGIPGAPASPDNGAVRVYVPMPDGTRDSTNFNFYWSIGGTAKPIGSQDHIGNTYSGLAQGQYTVYAVHKTVSCGSDTARINVGQITPAVNARVDRIRNNDNCKDPNGELKVVVNDPDGDGVGAAPSLFEYTWYIGPLVLSGDTINVSDVADGLDPGTYSVLVIEKATGCPGIDSEDVLNDIVPFTLDTTHVDITCSALTSGSVTATVGGSTSGYDFFWSDGNFPKPTPDHNQSHYPNRPAGNYTVFALDLASECTSDTVTVTVRQTLPPVITGITKNSDQLSCTTNVGSATVNVQGNVADFDFQWYVGPNTVTAYTGTGATTPTASDMPAGTYTVKVTGKTTGCSTTAQVTIAGPGAVSLVNLVTTNQTTCTPNNAQIEVTSVSPGVPADYTFEWYDGSAVVAAKLIPGVTGNILTNATAGKTYTVRARHNVYGCMTPARQATPVNNVVPITLSPPTLVEPNDCTTNTGSIDITVSTPNTNGYDFVWFRGGAAVGTPLTTVVSTATTSRLEQIGSANYTVQVTNRDTGCRQSFTIFLGFLNGHRLSPVSQTDINNCIPGTGGSITSLLGGTGAFTTGDYTIYLYDGSFDPAPPVDNGTVIASGPGFNYTAVGGFDTTTLYYTMVAVAGPGTGSLQGCRASTTFEIRQSSVDPTIDANATATNTTSNKFCKTEVSGNSGNGSIDLVLGSGVSADFNYTWTSDTDPTFTAATEDVTGLKPGEYRVRVTDNGGVNAGCFTENVFTVLNVPMDITVNEANGDFTVANVTECGPDGVTPVTDGSLAFVRFMVDGAPVTNFAGYTFDWRKVDNTAVADNDAVPGDIGGLGAGEYFVTAVDNTSNCDITASFVIEDETLNSIAVDLLRFVTPTKCLKPMNVLGELEVNATSAVAATFTYNWFAGPNTSSPPYGNVTPDGKTAQSIVPGFFTVQVENNTTHCRVFETYELKQDTALLTIAASSSPVTFCINPDGKAYAIVTSDDNVPTDYDYRWYYGTAVKPAEDFFGKLVDNAIDSTYLVVATDRLDADCSVRDTVVVENLQVYPTVTAEATSPQTNCDVLKADGIAYASVGGNVIDYNFDWFGETITPPPFAVGSMVGNLRDSLYTVIGTHIVTGCADTAQVDIQFTPKPSPVVTVEIISHVTSCVEDNGALSASVGGNIADYTFEWYIGDAVKTSPDFVGVIYDSLAVGLYTVRATSLITGCVSDPVTEEILYRPVEPLFNFEVIPASCEEENGKIILNVYNDVDIAEVIWETENGTIIGDPVLTGIPAGHYIVTVVTQAGCQATREVDLLTDIRPFNGVSRNGDGKNDYFHINCIGDFPDNIVRIFNRAGTLVYEDRGYDNIDIFFDGKSNKGISVMGNNLPDGTYYYIIDKRDGSKPLAGYLEIVN